MKKLFVLGFITFACFAKAGAQSYPTPKMPVQMPAATAQQYINNYKANTLNYFAYGYLLDIAKAKALSPTAIRVYNGLTSDSLQRMAMVPLNTLYKVNTAGQCAMLSDNHLCPRMCGVSVAEEGAQVSGSEVSSAVNTCMECHRYEAVNALVVFTPILNAIATQGFSHVRIYNGMDASNKRYVVYVPVDAGGRDASPASMYVGDYTSALANCKYP